VKADFTDKKEALTEMTKNRIQPTLDFFPKKMVNSESSTSELQMLKRSY
jgi:hypothetical protein